MLELTHLAHVETPSLVLGTGRSHQRLWQGHLGHEVERPGWKRYLSRCL